MVAMAKCRWPVQREPVPAVTVAGYLPITRKRRRIRFGRMGSWVVPVPGRAGSSGPAASILSRLSVPYCDALQRRRGPVLNVWNESGTNRGRIADSIR